MIKLISSPDSIGLEYTPTGIKCARLAAGGKTPTLINLSVFQPTKDRVKLLYIHHPILTTGLDGKDVLIRPLHLPLVKEKDIHESLAFQAEPLLPYTTDQAYLTYEIVSKTADSTELTLISAKKEAIQRHLELWNSIQIEPEKISCTPSALCEFASNYISNEKTFLILNLHHQETTCCLIKDGKLWASFAKPEGFNLLLEAQLKEGRNTLPQSEIEWQTIAKQKETLLSGALSRLQKEVTKMGFALSKECKKGAIEGVVITGEASYFNGLGQVLVNHLNLTLLSCQPQGLYTTQDLHYYALPIGLALGSLPSRPHIIDFRQQESVYPHPWRRLKIPITMYFIAIFLLSFLFYFFGRQYLQYERNQIKQEYVDLLTSMNKSHKDFEVSFSAKKPNTHDAFDGEIPKIEQLKQEDLAERLIFLQKELQAAPDSFPLFANIPRVTDVLAWLTMHPAVVTVDVEGNKQSKLQIENFSYTMLKRPQQGKKQEKYQVKVELEFTSPTPKLAREFHDALIVPNDWIDPKGEVKWNSNRGKYKTSFFLKDKTSYPSF